MEKIFLRGYLNFIQFIGIHENTTANKLPYILNKTVPIILKHETTLSTLYHYTYTSFKNHFFSITHILLQIISQQNIN